MNWKKATAIASLPVLFLVLTACFCTDGIQEELMEQAIERSTGEDVDLDLDGNGNITMTGPDGESMSWGGGVDFDAIGLPAYPGADFDPQQCHQMEMNGGYSISAALTTNDSVQQVADWYNAQMSGMPDFNKMIMGSGDNTIANLTAMPDAQTYLIVNAARENNQTMIILSRNGEGQLPSGGGSRSGLR